MNKFHKIRKELRSKYPTRIPSETPEEYEERTGIELKILKHDTVTGETLYEGFGWYDPNAFETL